MGLDRAGFYTYLKWLFQNLGVIERPRTRNARPYCRGGHRPSVFCTQNLKDPLKCVLMACTAALIMASMASCDNNNEFNVNNANTLKYCYADVTGDKTDEIILLTASDEVTPFGRAGDTLYILSPGKNLNGRHEIIYKFDVSAMKPLNVMAGDVNRDGVNEVSLKVYKTAEFDPTPAQRPFFFNVSNGTLRAIWLGSRLARPFVDYTLADLNGDGYDEIASLETVPDGYLLAAYAWDSFGFTCYNKSAVFPAIDELHNMKSPPEWMRIALEGLK